MTFWSIYLSITYFVRHEPNKYLLLQNKSTKVPFILYLRSTLVALINMSTRVFIHKKTPLTTKDRNINVSDIQRYFKASWCRNGKSYDRKYSKRKNIELKRKCLIHVLLKEQKCKNSRYIPMSVIINDINFLCNYSRKIFADAKKYVSTFFCITVQFGELFTFFFPKICQHHTKFQLFRCMPKFLQCLLKR